MIVPMLSNLQHPGFPVKHLPIYGKGINMKWPQSTVMRILLGLVFFVVGYALLATIMWAGLTGFGTGA